MRHPQEEHGCSGWGGEHSRTHFHLPTRANADMEVSLAEFAERVKAHPLYMILGHGAKNQFKCLPDLRGTVKEISDAVPKNAAFLYFGDAPNKDAPDIGYAFELLHEYNPDIAIFMIQISEAKDWGIPKFVKCVFWHSDYTATCKWGGIDPATRLPGSNTKQWHTLVYRHGMRIEKAFTLGGGPITADEVGLLRVMGVPIQGYRMQRKYAGDGKTLE